MKTYIGIDCGKEGAIASIYPDGDIIFHDTPTLAGASKGKGYDLPEMRRILMAANKLAHTLGGDAIVCIEKQQAMPGQGVSSTFQTGMGYGIWQGLVVALGIPYELVHPTTWKKSMMRDMGKEKDASRIKARQMFPHIAGDLKRKKDHNRADALLIAAYAMRRDGVELPGFVGAEELTNEQ